MSRFGKKYERPKEVVLGQFLEGLNQATGAASHMIHHHQDTRWFRIRGILETVHTMCVNNAVNPMLKPKPIPGKFIQ